MSQFLRRTRQWSRRLPASAALRLPGAAHHQRSVDFTKIRLFLKLALLFEFIINGPPVSQQARRRERVRQWRDEVRRTAEQHWPVGALPATGPIMLTITYFYESVSMDIDNIPKPISDALKGLVYLDDEQVTDVLCRKRDLNSSLRIESPSSVLADGLSRGNEFLYIVVEEAPDQEVIS